VSSKPFAVKWSRQMIEGECPYAWFHYYDMRGYFMLWPAPGFFTLMSEPQEQKP